METKSIRQQDKKVYAILKGEMARQREGLELIPSENYVSRAVLEAMGSVFTNKYSEGYPGKRYYGGQEWADRAEELARERLLKIFLDPADKTKYHANVQPYSGSPANIEVLFALLDFGDKVMGMSLDQGGHLTHGHKVNFSGKAYSFYQYNVDKKTNLLNYNKIEKLARKIRPKLIISGATAYPRKIDFRRFQKIAEGVGAIHLADISHIAGLIVGGVHGSPFPFTDVVTTTTHKTLRGPRSAVIICKKKFAKAIDRAVFPGMQGGPHDHTTLAKAVAFGEAKKANFKHYALQIVKNSKALGKALSSLGFDLITGGSDNHLLLADLSNMNIPGKVAQEVLDSVGITLNKNTVPYDKRSPFDPSGIRFGTPALTTRGMKEPEMVKLAHFMSRTLSLVKVSDKKIKSQGPYPKFRTSYTLDRNKLKGIKSQVKKLALRFPVPGTLE